MSSITLAFIGSHACLSSWSFKRKWAATAIVSGFTFISPVSSSMVAPATNQVAAQFGIHNSIIIALTTSIFVLAYGKSNLLQCVGSVSFEMGSRWPSVLRSFERNLRTVSSAPTGKPMVLRCVTLTSINCSGLTIIQYGILHVASHRMNHNYLASAFLLG